MNMISRDSSYTSSISGTCKKIPKIFTLFLSADGDSATIKALDIAERRTTVSFDLEETHPVIKQAKECDSHEKVLSLLHDLKDNPQLIEPNGKTVFSTEEKPLLGLYHSHHPKYRGHRNPICFFSLPYLGQHGGAHKDTIDQMIEFVEKRQHERNYNYCQKLTNSMTQNKALLMLGALGFFVSGGTGLLLGAFVGFSADQVSTYHYQNDSSDYNYRRKPGEY
jgi:hypothetical protein